MTANHTHPETRGFGTLTSRDAVFAFIVTTAIAAAITLGPMTAVQYHLTLFGTGFNSGLAAVTAAVIFVILAAYTCLRYQYELFRHRFNIAIALLIFAGAISGVNISRLDPTDLAFLIVLSFWIAVMLIEHRRIATDITIMIMLAVLAACSLASIINGLMISIITQHQMLSKIMVMFLVTNLINTADRQRFAVRCFLYIALVAAAVGIFSECLYLATGIEFTFDDAAEFHHKQTPFGMMLRVTGFMTTPQSFAHLMLLALGLTLFADMARHTRILSCLALLAAIGMTFSIGAYLTAAAVLLVGLYMHRPQYALQYSAAIALLGLVLFITGGMDWLIQHVVLAIGGRGYGDRIEFIRVGLEAIRTHPLFGLGLRNVGRVLPTPVHNAYLQTAAEMGVVAGATLASLVIYLTAALAIRALRSPDTRTKATCKAMFLAMTALAIHLCFEPAYDNFVSWLYMGMAGGSLCVFHALAKRNGIDYEQQNH